MSSKNYKETTTLEQRVEECKRIRSKHPDRIPVIVQKADKCDLPDIDKKKFLVPADLTYGQLMHVIRKRIKLKDDQAIFIFVNNTMPPSNILMSQLYKENAELGPNGEVSFLFCVYQSESTFGCASC